MALWLSIVLGFFVFTFEVDCKEANETIKYDNYSLFRFRLTNESQAGVLENFFDPQQYEVLKKSRSLNDSFDVLVSPVKNLQVRDFAKENNFIFEVKESDYGRRIAETQFSTRRRSTRSNFFFSYHSFSEVQKYLESLAKSKPEIVQLEELGTTFEGRKLKIVKISKNRSARNPVIFIDAGIHAREWVAPVMALYIIHRLTSGDQSELNGVDWHILPMVNPDGYEYTRNVDRMWRKTRSFFGYKDCKGVDGNRNYGFKWAVSGVSNNPCDRETYAGPNAFSEPETRAVRSGMVKVRDRLKLYVSLHAYGQYLVYPWGYTGDSLPKSWKKLDGLAKKVSQSVVAAGGRPFKVLSAGQWYPAAGGSDDFAFGAMGAPYSYTMELTDDYEFIFPEEELGKVLPALYVGFETFGSEIRREFGFRRNRIKDSDKEVDSDKQDTTNPDSSSETPKYVYCWTNASPKYFHNNRSCVARIQAPPATRSMPIESHRFVIESQSSDLEISSIGSFYTLKELVLLVGKTFGHRVTVLLDGEKIFPIKCKVTRPCYIEMVKALKRRDEVPCVEDASYGDSTILVFLKGLSEYCSEFIDVKVENMSFEGRPLYEVVISTAEPHTDKDCATKPVILIDAGQDAGQATTQMALFVIEKLVGCVESHELTQAFRWVVLPCTNPDGLEYSRINHIEWRKNKRPVDDGLAFGVDISRNFDSQWKTCGLEPSVFNPQYNGQFAASENETMFVQRMIQKYKQYTKLYLSFRRDGHHILYPKAYSQDNAGSPEMAKLAAEVAIKVNARAGGVQLFLNDTIYNANAKPVCGHSVDYASDQGIPFAYEFRMFLSSDERIMQKFHTLPRGYESSLRMGYLTGIRVMCNYLAEYMKKSVT